MVAGGRAHERGPASTRVSAGFGKDGYELVEVVGCSFWMDGWMDVVPYGIPEHLLNVVRETQLLGPSSMVALPGGGHLYMEGIGSIYVMVVDKN